MAQPVFFDHVEIHVDDIPRYCDFLVRLFNGGRFRQISESGVCMFLTPQGQAFEIKRRLEGAPPPARSGVCLPCIRTAGAREHLARLGLSVDEAAENPGGEVLFFTDHEGVQWHAKSYPHLDAYVSW